MKFIFLILLQFYSSSNTEHEHKTTLGDQSAISNKNIEVVDVAFKFQGDWISKSYVNKMNETRSPYEAQKGSFQNIYIDTTLVEGEFLGISIYTYGDSETPPISYFKKTNSNQFQFSHSKFGTQQIGDACKEECNNLIVKNEKGKKSIRLITEKGNLDFIQLEKNCGDSHLCELNEYSNKHFLSGSYVLMNGDGKELSSKFQIMDNGITEGFKEIKRMQVWTYFREINGIFNDDVIQIGALNDQLEYYQGKEENVFYFEVNNDEILLFSLKVDMEDYSVKKDNLKYILKKK